MSDFLLAEDGSLLLAEDGLPILTEDPMTIQTASNVQVRIAREAQATPGTAAAAGATPCHIMRIVGSAGLELKRAQIKSNELRDDGDQDFGANGFKSVDGSYQYEVTAGGATDMLAEAIQRSTWSASSLLFTCDGGVAHTSIAFTANTATLAGTDTWTATHSVKKGDVMRFGAVGATIDNINCLVVDVAAQVLTFAGTPLAIVGADSNATATRLKKVISATTPNRWSHTIEQVDQDTDTSERFDGCRCVGFNISCKPGEKATFTAEFVGMDRTILTAGSSPYFSGATTTTSVAMSADDSAVWFNGAAAAYVTGFDLNFKLDANAPAVLGSYIPPDVMDTLRSCEGTITMMRTGLANATLFDADTAFLVGILLQAPGSAPRDCFSITLPRVGIAALSAPVGGTSGPKVETVKLKVGVAVAATGLDATLANIGSSAA